MAIVTYLPKSAFASPDCVRYVAGPMSGFSIVDVPASVITTGAASNLTTGVQFYVIEAVSLVSVRFWWTTAAAVSIKVSLWDSGASRLATSTSRVTPVQGLCGLGLSYSLAPYTNYQITTWETSSNYTTDKIDQSTHPMPTDSIPYLCSDFVVITNPFAQTAGDACPTFATGATTNHAALSPVLVRP